jgi:hypothetical protein
MILKEMGLPGPTTAAPMTEWYSWPEKKIQPANASFWVLCLSCKSDLREEDGGKAGVL